MKCKDCIYLDTNRTFGRLNLCRFPTGRDDIKGYYRNPTYKACAAFQPMQMEMIKIEH